MTEAFCTYLEDRLQGELPGRKAQLRMAPEPIDEGPRRRLEPAPSARNSSVLILLFPSNSGLSLILTHRSDEINHGGQLSFPGGGQEGSESITETALREAWEEIGIQPGEVRIVGELTTLYVHNSRNLVHPIVGCLDKSPKLTIDPREVQEAFSVAVEDLLFEPNYKEEEWELRTYRYKVPYWNIHRVPLWGATAMILSELVELYQDFREGEPQRG